MSLSQSNIFYFIIKKLWDFIFNMQRDQDFVTMSSLNTLQKDCLLKAWYTFKVIWIDNIAKSEQ
jgi:hypothetical protein